MPLAEIHLSATQALWPLLAAFAVLVGFVVWAYGRTAGSTAVRSVCTVLKIIGLAALVLCLPDNVGQASRLPPPSKLAQVSVNCSRGALAGQARRLTYYAR